MRRCLVRMGIAALGWSSFAAAASPVGRDAWLVPKTPVMASLEEAKDIPVSLFVGDRFAAEEEDAFGSAQTTRLVLLHGGESVPIDAAPEGALPFARLRLPTVGGYLFAVDRAPATTFSPAIAFEELLRAEKLDAVIADRQRRGETGLPGRERVTHYLKAFVEVASFGDESFDRTVGQELELLPGNDPVHMKVGGKLQMLAQLHGAPLTQKHVEALSRVGDDVRSTWYTTDDDGMFFIQIDRAALWLVRVVEMDLCQTCTDADWQTLRATYVFESGGPDHETMTSPPMTDAWSRGESLRRALFALLFVFAAAAAVYGWSRRTNVSRGGGTA
jgi:Domain of unknown function (DUF4198)